MGAVEAPDAEVDDAGANARPVVAWNGDSLGASAERRVG
jgi:hypothetical protein